MHWIIDTCLACGKSKMRDPSGLPVHRDCFEHWPDRDAYTRDEFERFPERSWPFFGFLLHRDAPIAISVFVSSDDVDGVALALRHVRAMAPVHIAARDWTSWLAKRAEMQGLPGDVALVATERPRLAAAFPSTEAIVGSALVRELLAAGAEANAARQAEEREQDLVHQRLAARVVMAMFRERPRPCPHCAEVRDDVRFVDGGTERRSFLVCQGCGRSFETL
jgi:hypothetical protein